MVVPFESVDETQSVWPFKWKLLNSSFMWYYLLCCWKVVLTFKSVDCVAIHMKAIKQYLHVVLFIMLYKVILTLKSVFGTLVCDHSIESYWAVLSCGVFDNFAKWICEKFEIFPQFWTWHRGSERVKDLWIMMTSQQCTVVLWSLLLLLFHCKDDLKKAARHEYQEYLRKQVQSLLLLPVIFITVNTGV